MSLLMYEEAHDETGREAGAAMAGESDAAILLLEQLGRNLGVQRHLVDEVFHVERDVEQVASHAILFLGAQEVEVVGAFRLPLGQQVGGVADGLRHACQMLDAIHLLEDKEHGLHSFPFCELYCGNLVARLTGGIATVQPCTIMAENRHEFAEIGCIRATVTNLL